MEQIIEIRAVIKGLVQGVGFRATVRHYAQKHGMRGTVRNLADGNVEVFVQGNKHTLEKFFDHLNQEFGDYIQDIERETIPAKDYEDFHIIR